MPPHICCSQEVVFIYFFFEWAVVPLGFEKGMSAFCLAVGSPCELWSFHPGGGAVEYRKKKKVIAYKMIRGFSQTSKVSK